MHTNFMQMAKTLEVPSLGVAPAPEIGALSPWRQRAMAGYGVIEKIGEPTCLTYIVPFLRPNAALQSESLLGLTW